MPSLTPTHDESRQRFFLTFPEGQAELTYERNAAGVVFTHTFVPPSLRGRGLAEILVRAGLAWAADEKNQVSATCSYVARFLPRKV